MQDTIKRSSTRQRLRFGQIWVDVLTFDQALQAVRELVECGTGGAIFTPNVDHVILAEDLPDLRRAYRRADLAFADGAPLLWTSHILRPSLPAKLSGADMVLPLARLAARHGWGIYLLGGLPGAAAEAAERLRVECGVRVVGTDDSLIPADLNSAENRAIVARIKATSPDLVFVALGAPKQELWIERALDEICPAVAIGVGASLDFLAGRVRRAPALMSSAGLEWVYRLAQEPRRLWRRYLIRGPRFVAILWRMTRLPRTERVRSTSEFPRQRHTRSASGKDS
jgi:N-acetylglucosaminyldiphosphoundecaprenol N-acetyl-beta-D-mannosaminyltransferase